MTTLYERMNDPAALKSRLDKLFALAIQLKLMGPTETMADVSAWDIPPATSKGAIAWRTRARNNVSLAALLVQDVLAPTGRRINSNPENSVEAWDEISKAHGYLQACSDTLNQRVRAAADGNAARRLQKDEALKAAIEPFRGRMSMEAAAIELNGISSAFGSVKTIQGRLTRIFGKDGWRVQAG